LAHLAIDYPRVHSLETLIELLNAKGHSLPPNLAAVTNLTPFATVFRYEGLPISAAFDRAEALRMVQGLRTHVERMVGDSPNLTGT
jgi:hypothetical protein